MELPAAQYVEQAAQLRKQFEEKLARDDWKEVQSKDGVVVSKCTVQGTPTSAFLADFQLEPTFDDLKVVYREFHDIPTRIKWDKKALHPDSAVLHRFPDSQVSIERSVTHPALGGVISSREFVDLKGWSVEEDGSKAYFWAETLQQHPFGASGSGRVEGRNFVSGMLVEKGAEGEKYRTRIIWHTTLGGWLPYSTAESALPGTLHATAVAFREHMKKISE